MPYVATFKIDSVQRVESAEGDSTIWMVYVSHGEKGQRVFYGGSTQAALDSAADFYQVWREER